MHELLRVSLGTRDPRATYYDGDALSMPTNKMPSRRLSPSSWNASSSASPGVLQVHTLAGDGPWVVEEGGGLDSQLDGLDHGLNPFELSRPVT